MSNHATSTHPNPRKIENLRTEALKIVARIRTLQEEQLDTITRYLRGLQTRRLASDVRAEIADLEEQLDLLVAEFIDHRRI